MAAEAHLLATLPPGGRPLDQLSMAGVMKLMALATEPTGAQRGGCRMTSHREPGRNHLLYRLAPANVG
jgi:hypothetical protein